MLISAPDSPIDIQIHDETSSSVIMKWRVRDGSAKPDFEIKVKDFQTSNVVQVHSTYRNECSIKDLKPDHRYVFCIAAKNSGGTSSYLDKTHKTKPKSKYCIYERSFLFIYFFLQINNDQNTYHDRPR